MRDAMKATQADLRSWKPCWKQDRLDAYLAKRPQEFSALDVIESWPGLTAEEILWVTLRVELIPLRILQEFAIDVAEHVPQPDQRSVRALQTARSYLRGEGDREELAKASSSADAAYAAANAAYALYNTVAAYTAVRAAHAARAAADAAADAAAHAADAAYLAAARAAASCGVRKKAESEWQVKYLKELLTHAEEVTR